MPSISRRHPMDLRDLDFGSQVIDPPPNIFNRPPDFFINGAHVWLDRVAGIYCYADGNPISSETAHGVAIQEAQKSESFVADCSYCSVSLYEGDNINLASGQGFCNACFEQVCDTCHSCKQVFYSGNLSKVTRNGLNVKECYNCKNFNMHLPYAVRSESFNNVKSKRFYGLELETISPEEWDDDYTPPQFEGFSAGEDGSINGNGVEYRSNLLQGDDGLARAFQLCSSLKNRHDYKVDKSCGFHVHIDARDLTPKQIINLISFVRVFDEVIFSFMPSSRRNDNQYCGRISHGRNELKESIGKLYKFYSRFAGRSRYKGFNTQSLWKYGTLEFRYHGGTLDFPKIKHWLLTCLAIVETQKDHFWSFPIQRLRPSLKNLRRFCGLLKLPIETKEYLEQRYNRFNGE